MKTENFIFIAVIAVALLGAVTYFGQTKVAPPGDQVSATVKELGGDAGVDGRTWLVSFAQAKRLSESTGRPILADFTGSDWCGWCIRLDEDVFSRPQFQQWAKDNVILLKLDFPRSIDLAPALASQNRKLAEVYRVSGFPTVLFLDAKGNPIGQSGYRTEDPNEWIKDASAKIKA